MSNHGGARPGSGRIAGQGTFSGGRKPGVTMERHTVTAPPDVWALLASVGDGNVSAGLRKIASQYVPTPTPPRRL